MYWWQEGDQRVYQFMDFEGGRLMKFRVNDKEELFNVKNEGFLEDLKKQLNKVLNSGPYEGPYK